MMGEAIEVEVDAAAAAPPSTLQVPSGDESDLHQRQLADFSQSDHRRKVKKRHIIGGLVALLAVILAVVLGVAVQVRTAVGVRVVVQVRVLGIPLFENK